MKKIITAFKEHKEFKNKNPWDVNRMIFPAKEIVPPHYAETIEVLLCCNLKGTVSIGTNRYILSGNQAFYISPNTIHSMSYEECDGEIFVVKLNLENLKKYMDINIILKKSRTAPSDLCPEISDFYAVKEISGTLASESCSFTAKLIAVLRLFELLVSNSPDSHDSRINSMNDSDMHNIISWTEENFKNRITLDDAAQKFGYTKQYFCNKFKASTGTTYLSYINTLRISNACNLLKNGGSVSEACFMSGFSDLSYFIQLFKRTVGTTPKKYKEQLG